MHQGAVRCIRGKAPITVIAAAADNLEAVALAIKEPHRDVGASGGGVGTLSSSPFSSFFSLSPLSAPFFSFSASTFFSTGGLGF